MTQRESCCWCVTWTHSQSLMNGKWPQLVAKRKRSLVESKTGNQVLVRLTLLATRFIMPSRQWCHQNQETEEQANVEE